MTERQTARLFPNGVPRLWCPTLTHFRAAGEPDGGRIRTHLRSLAPHVKGILVPGSTGEGWEMSDADIIRLLDIALEAAREAGIHVLIGVLKTDVPAMLECIRNTVAHLQRRAGAETAVQALQQAGVVGFTVCPPKGATLSQAEIKSGLIQVLEFGYPTALYQLPRMTENEMAPETISELAAGYPNFILFKDSSGADRVATSGPDFEGVFLVRGAESGYAEWTRAGGGPYDGLLLSTANVFAQELSEILGSLDRGEQDAAHRLALRIEGVVNACFAMVADFDVGNASTNAAKSLDHIRAFGAAADQHNAPLLYSDTRLPREFVSGAAKVLYEHGFEWRSGYMRSRE